MRKSFSDLNLTRQVTIKINRLLYLFAEGNLFLILINLASAEVNEVNW